MLFEKLVFGVVFAVVSVVVSSKVLDLLDLKLSAAFLELSFAFSAIVFFASGESGVLGEAVPTPLSTLWKERCAGRGFADVRLRPGLA